MLYMRLSILNWYLKYVTYMLCLKEWGETLFDFSNDVVLEAIPKYVLFLFRKRRKIVYGNQIEA